MEKLKMTDGAGVASAQAESLTERVEYRTPTLTVVGTVHDLTLGVSNVGGVDGLYKTGGGG